MQSADIGVVGLGVMGQNLALNIGDHGFGVCVYNRSREKLEYFMGQIPSGAAFIAADSLAALATRLRRPRIVILMVVAGAAVDEVIEALLPHLDPGDVIIDGGNSRFTDSDRRYASLKERGIRFVGCGISGGEEGARHGPSMMPGGDEAAWPVIRPILQRICARADDEPCCQWVGDGGSGHYVKMVHNGIEYGDMQLIAEAYHLMRSGLGISIDEIQRTFAQWNLGVLDSYLVEITANILKVKEDDGTPLLDRILDTAGQKGTGKWTGISALELGVPLTLIGEAVFARFLSARKEEREAASTLFPRGETLPPARAASAAAALHDALYASKIVSYAQGFMLMRDAAEAYGWRLNLGEVALMWRGGCIIRSRFLGDIKKAFARDPGLTNLIRDPFFADALRRAEAGWRATCALGISQGIPLPAMTAALAFFDGYRHRSLPANLIQAQRDYFGAHTYERTDRPRGEYHHTDWTRAGASASPTKTRD